MIKQILFVYSVLNIVTSELEVLHHTFAKPDFNILQPVGFSVSVPSDNPIDYVQFYGGTEKPEDPSVIRARMYGELDHHKLQWIYINNRTLLENGDTLYYWLVYVIKDAGVYKRIQKMYSVRITR